MDQGETVVLLVGSEAWTRAKSKTWFFRCKVVVSEDLPLDRIDWSFLRRFEDTLIFVFGDRPRMEFITKVAAHVLGYHELVLLVIARDGATLRFNSKSERVES